MCRSISGSLLALLCIATVVAASDGTDVKPPESAKSRIVGVTVYQNSALITREVDVPEGVGPLELIVSGLPPQTVNSSLYSEGTDGIRVLTTRFRTRAIQQDTREEVRKLESQIKEHAATAQKIQAEIKTIEQNNQLLTKLEGFTAATTHQATEKASLNSETVISLTKYLMSTRSEQSKQVVALQQQLQANQEVTEFTRRKLQELASGFSRTERDAIIVVDKKNAPAGKARLNYLVNSASWRPQYKFRAGTKDKDPIQLEYLSAIVQQSGEDWENVNLILSTAQPMLNAAPPDLKVLEIRVYPQSRGLAGSGAMAPTAQIPAPNQSGIPGMNIDAVGRGQARDLRNRAQSEFNARKDGNASTLYNEAAALEQQSDLLEPREVALAANPKNRYGSADEGPTVTYHLRGKLSVPSRRDEQILEVARIEMQPEYYFKAVPVLTPHVYRQASMTNKSQYVLLPGEATMYIGTDFVGRMDLPLVAIGEQFTAGLGVDPQLQVHRQLVDKSKTTQGGNQVLKFDYRILVSSYKPESVKVQVWDRLPRAENETAGISLVKATPEISTDSLYLREQRPGNLLRWDMTVDPNRNGEKAMAIQYEFKLEMDRQMLIGNLTPAGLPAPSSSPKP